MPPNTPPATPPPLKGSSSDLLEPGEHVVVVVHKTIIGILALYLQAFIAIIVLLGLFIVLAPNILNNLDSELNRLIVAGVFFALVLIVLVLFVATYIYRQSKLLITDRSLVQIVQRGLFVRKVSRLSFSNVEDVSADQKGIFQTIFNYGTLMIQTAGEMENFGFSWCPNPNFYADQVIEARQHYAESLKESNERP